MGGGRGEGVGRDICSIIPLCNFAIYTAANRTSYAVRMHTYTRSPQVRQMRSSYAKGGGEGGVRGCRRRCGEEGAVVVCYQVLHLLNLFIGVTSVYICYAW